MKLVTLALAVVLSTIIGDCSGNGAIFASIADQLDPAGDERSSVSVVSTYVQVSLKECFNWTLSKSYGSLGSLNFRVTDDKTAVGTCTVLQKIPSRDDLLKNPCEPNPCENGGKCIAKGCDDFKCDCNYPTGGKTCDKLICSNCDRDGELVIFWDTSVPFRTWRQSYEYCESRGLTLLMDDEYVKHDYVRHVLTRLYPSAESKVTFWIGVNRTSIHSPFKYVDGRPLLDSYPPSWMPDRPKDGLCVELSGGQYNWVWYDDFCNVHHFDKWAYYPLCEKTYSFFKH